MTVMVTTTMIMGSYNLASKELLSSSELKSHIYLHHQFTFYILFNFACVKNLSYLKAHMVPYTSL